MGSIPIVKNTTLVPIYLVVSDLTKLSVDILDNLNLHIKNMSFSMELLMMKYWQNKIFSYINSIN